MYTYRYRYRYILSIYVYIYGYIHAYVCWNVSYVDQCAMVMDRLRTRRCTAYARLRELRPRPFRIYILPCGWIYRSSSLYGSPGGTCSTCAWPGGLVRASARVRACARVALAMGVYMFLFIYSDRRVRFL